MSTYCYGLKTVVHDNTGRTSEKCVRSDQDRIYVTIDVNGKFLIRCLGKTNLWKILASRVDQVEGEGAEIEGRETYHRIRVEDGTDFTPPA